MSTTNLGRRFLSAGFADLASEHAARGLDLSDDEKPADHARQLAVAINERRLDESNREKRLHEKAEEVNSFRLKVSRPAMDGTFVGRETSFAFGSMSGEVSFDVNSDGSALGQIKAPHFAKASFAGRLIGRCLWFRWFEDVVPPTQDPSTGIKLASMLSSASGYGYLVIGKNSLEGFTANGEELLDPERIEGLRHWKLRAIK